MSNTINESERRFSGAPWAKCYTPVQNNFVLGVGGIGSWFTLLLTRTNIAQKIYLFDDDTIESHNLGGQLFRTNQVACTKVSAISALSRELAISPNVRKVQVPRKVQNNIPAFSYKRANYFSCFDNMEARQYAFQHFLENTNQGVFIDGRLTMEQLQIFCIDRQDASAINDYKQNYLPNDEDVEDTVCSLKQTSHSAAMIASMMVGFYTNWVTNQFSDEERRLPFFTEYFIPLNMHTEV